jgi:hypothetical protein
VAGARRTKARRSRAALSLAGNVKPPIIRLMSEQETKVEAPKPEPEPEPRKLPKEIGGPPGPEPTRYGDWQYKGRVTDF